MMLKTLSYALQTFQTKLRADRLFRIRFFATILCLDFVSFVSLASIDIGYFFNPLQFMSPPPADNRVTLKMFYPPALSLEKVTREGEHRGLIQIDQKVHQEKVSRATKMEQEVKLAQNIELIIHELTIGVNNIRVKRTIKNKSLIRTLWVHKKKLIIHLDDNLWNKLNVTEKNMIKDSIFLSVTQNFTQIKDVIWTF